MSMDFKPGDRIVSVAEDATRGLLGTIKQAYGEDGYSVVLDKDTAPDGSGPGLYYLGYELRKVEG